MTDSNNVSETQAQPVQQTQQAQSIQQAQQTQSAQTTQPVETEQSFRVHNSYIWLTSLQMVATLIIVFLIMSAMWVSEFVSEDGFEGMMLAGGMMVGTGILFFAIIAICFLAQWISYKNLHYSLGPNEFSLYKGILNKQRIHVPYAKVQSVDKRAQLLQRIFGVCSLNIDTAGGENNKAIIVPYITKAQADWLISQLYARKMNAMQPAATAQPGQPATAAQPIVGQPISGQTTAAPVQQTGFAGQPGQPATAAQPGQPATGNILDVGNEAWNQFGGVFAGQAAPAFDTISYQYGLSNKELFLSGLSSSTAFYMIVLSVVCMLLEVFDFLSDVFPTETTSTVDNIGQFVLSSSATPAFAAIGIGIIGIFIVIWILSAVGACINYGGFRARRYTDRIEVEHGLLQHTSASVSIERVQAVVIKQTFIRRLIGYCELSLDKVDAVANNNNSAENKNLNQKGLVVHPFIKKSKVPEILAGLLPEYNEAPVEETPVASVAMRRAIVRRCIWQGGGFWLALVTLIAQLVFNASVDLTMDDQFFSLWNINLVAAMLYVIAAVIFVVDLVGAIFWARESGFAFNRRFMRMTNGGLSRETRMLPKQKVQFGFTRTNPLQKMAKTTTINISTAAGTGTQNSLIDVEMTEALRWLDWLKPVK